MLHTIRHQAFQEILFGFMAFEIEFVMNLNDHSGHQSFFLNAFLDTDHSHFYNIATLIMSAALPCIGALMAFRSAIPLTTAFREFMSRR